MDSNKLSFEIVLRKLKQTAYRSGETRSTARRVKPLSFGKITESWTGATSRMDKKDYETTMWHDAK